MTYQIVLGWRYCRRSQSDGRRRCIIHSLSSQRDNEYRLAARRDAGALALPAHGVHAVRNGRCRRSARLGTARQQAPRMSSRRPFPRPLPPGFIAPCLPTASDRCKSGPEWVHEIKHDVYRLIARRSDDRVRLYTRRGFNWADRYPRIVEALRSLPVRSIVIDGEAVVCRAGTCPTAPGDAGVGSRSRTRRAWPCCGYRWNVVSRRTIVS